VINLAERGGPTALELQREALPIRVFSRRITKPFCYGERFGEFATSNHCVTRLLTLLTLKTV